jgi:hypothetical protein
VVEAVMENQVSMAGFLLTSEGLLFVFAPAAFLLLFKHYRVEVVRDGIWGEYLRTRRRGADRPGKRSRFPMGFPKERVFGDEDKHSVWICFMPGVNLLLLVRLVCAVLVTKYLEGRHQRLSG